MQNLLKTLDGLSLRLGRTVSYLLLAMVLVTVSVVVIRYVFQSGSIVMQESITYLHASLLILAMAYCLQEGGHVRVDIFYQKMNKKKQALVNIVGSVFLLVPFCIFTLWISLPYVERSWTILEKSADAGGIPAVFLLKSLLIALPVLLFIQALIEILRNVLVLKGVQTVETGEGE